MDIKDLISYGYYNEDGKYIVVLDENRLKHDLKADEIRLNTNKEENVHGE